MIRLKELIAPSFYKIHQDLKEKKHTHYWLKGGRGSTKSSFISIEIVLGMMKDRNANAVVLRKVGQTLQGSVYEQLQWAVQVLGVEAFWQSKINPLEMKYTAEGKENKIVFRGADKPKKIKSTKFRKGYCKYVWYEEVDEFGGMEEIRNINQSLLRGGEDFCVFYSYNPPKSQRNWVNEEILQQREDRLVHHSTYLTVPKQWLGEPFFIEAQHLQKVKPDSYRHEYLGEVIGTGGNVFENVEIRTITEEEIKHFDRIYQGLDFGWFPDPLAFVRLHYDKARQTIYIFDEIYENKLPNKTLAQKIKQKGYTDAYIICDREPKSIYDLKDNGIAVKAALKGARSVEYGVKWLQSRMKIVIDAKRTPHTAKEFLYYEYEKNRENEFISGYPDKNNHSIDAVRYALESVFMKRSNA